MHPKRKKLFEVVSGDYILFSSPQELDEFDAFLKDNGWTNFEGREIHPGVDTNGWTDFPYRRVIILEGGKRRRRGTEINGDCKQRVIITDYKGVNKMCNKIKSIYESYFKEYEKFIIILTFLYALDYFIFKGEISSKINNMAMKIVKKLEAKLGDI